MRKYLRVEASGVKATISLFGEPCCLINLASRSNAEDSNALAITCFAELICEIDSGKLSHGATRSRASMVAFAANCIIRSMAPQSFLPERVHAGLLQAVFSLQLKTMAPRPHSR